MLLGKGGTGELQLVRPRQTGIEYYIDHCRGSLYVITNATAGSCELVSDTATAVATAAGAGVAAATTGEYRLAVMPVTALAQPGAESVHAVPWKDVVVPAAGSRIDDMDMFSNYIALYETHSSGAPALRIVPLNADGSSRTQQQAGEDWTR